MKKRIKIISSILATSMLLPNIAYAGELVDTEAVSKNVSSAISYGVDKLRNTAINTLSDISLETVVVEEEIVEEVFQDPGMELDTDDIQALYDMGYEIPDIEEAMRLSAVYGKTPYELLQLKGKKTYIPIATAVPEDNGIAMLAEVNAEGSEEAEEEIEEMPDYDFTVEETSWESVIMDLNEGNVVIDENQWEFIKLSGIDQYIDESMLSEEEKAALQNVDVTTLSEETAALSTTSDNTNNIDMYNDYIYPTSVQEHIKQGVYTDNSGVYINDITGNSIVKETDISLAGRNGLDLNLSRYYSVTDANDYDAVVLDGDVVTRTKRNTYYTVWGNPIITITYNEPLSNGSTTEEIYGNAVHIVPGRTNYYNGYEYGMFINHDAYKEDLARLAEGKEPEYLFTDLSAANKCVTHAANGRYDYVITFGSNSKIQKIEYDLQEEPFDVLTVGPYDVRIDETTYVNNTRDSNHAKYFDIGLGWSFDFPYIEKRIGELDQRRYEYLHFGAGEVWLIEELGTDGNGITEYGLKDYNLKDITLFEGNGTFNGKSYEYILTEKTGKKYYFGAKGQLLGIEDRYGNKILFEYDETSDDFVTRLTKITDSVGRTINITYSSNSKVLITVTDKNDSSQNRVIEYTKSGGNLISVKNAEGYITNYEYEDLECEASLVSKDTDKRPADIIYSTLTAIDHPSGYRKEIFYSRAIKNCGLEGEMQIPAAYAYYTYNYDAEDEYHDEIGHESYSRTTGNGNTVTGYDGYPSFKTIKEIPDEYRVRTNKQIREDKKSVRPVEIDSVYALSYDNTWLKENVITRYKEYVGETEEDEILTTLYLSSTDYEYNSQNLCTKETTRVYNDYDNDKDTYVETSKQYTYDTAKYGNLLSEKINGESNRTITYTYDTTYHLPTKQTYKKDASTTIVTNYTLTSDKKSVATATVTENNSTKKKRSYTYDAYGNVITERRYTGENGWNDYMEITYSYNDGRNVNNKLNGVYLNEVSVSGILDADGDYISTDHVDGVISQKYLYDWYGNTISETDGNGNVYQYTYDKIDRLTKVTNPDLSTKEYTFAVSDGVNDVSVKDENGNILKYSYDSRGEEKSVTDITNNVLLSERGRRSSYMGYLQWRTTQYSTQNGKTVTNQMYNSLGQLVELEVLDAAGNVLHHEKNDYQYAVDGLLSKTINTVYGDTEAEAVQNIQYTDKYGNVVKEEVVYNENGASKSAVSEYTYDLIGNLKTVREPRAKDENWASTEYTAQYEYDAVGNVTKETDINGKSVTNVFDGLGRLTSVTDKNGNTTLNTYDVLGRLLQEKIPFQKNGTSTVYAINKYFYDFNGNVTYTSTAKNAVGSTASYRTTQYEYNWQNQPTKVMGYDGSTVTSCVQYYYDSVGNLRRMYTGNINKLVINGLDSLSGTTSNYAVTKYEYDSMNRCISQTDALGQTTANAYDINGNLTQTTDRNGNVLTYKYDGLNQLLEKSSTRSTDDTYIYAYNKKGLRTSMSGGGTTSTYIYDNLGRLSKESLTNGAIKEYTYDINGNRKSFKLTNNGALQYTLTYDYDKMNRLTKVYENGTAKATYEYNDDGTLKKSSYGAQTTDYSYNLANLLTEVNNANANTQISKYTYTYYVDGNQASKTESVAGVSQGTTTYTYDGVNRLTKETTPDKTMTYTYDYYGNRSKLTVTGDEAYSTTYTYDKNNRLTKENKLYTANNNREVTDYYYDPNGNMISKAKSTHTKTSSFISMSMLATTVKGSGVYEYNSYNQLIQGNDSGTISTYTYDGDGLRQSKKVGSATTTHIWDGANLAADVVGSAVTKYIRGLQLISSKSGSTEKFYTYNGHGDVVQLTNSAGSITKKYNYDAFGVEQDIVSSDTNPFRYCGEYYDKESGNIYLRARYYSPVQGRFTTEDPIRDGLNWYGYANNNPILFVDPLGLKYISLRNTVEELGGTVTWNAETGNISVELDGNTLDVYDGDSIGTFIQDGVTYVWDEWFFPALATAFDLGKGWTGRIERDASGGRYDRHVHVYKGDKEYAQNEDGSPHDGSTGSPPDKVKESLKNKKGWDWNQKENEWIDKIEIYPGGQGVDWYILYPNGRFVTVLTYYIMGFPALSGRGLGRDELVEYYTGPTIINKNNGTNVTNVTVVPVIEIAPVTIPVTGIVPAYAF